MYNFQVKSSFQQLNYGKQGYEKTFLKKINAKIETKNQKYNNRTFIKNYVIFLKNVAYDFQ